METSILTSTKKILGLDEAYTAFDQDILTHINATFSTLTQLGVGPEVFQIEDAEPEWADFIQDDDVLLNHVKTYVYVKVRMLFDPPATSYLIAAVERQILELEWRMNAYREGLIIGVPDPVIDAGAPEDEPEP